MSRKVREVEVLEGVKFLSLNNRSHLGHNLNHRRFEQIDAVLRDLEVGRLLDVPNEVEPIKVKILGWEPPILEIPEDNNHPEPVGNPQEPFDEVASEIIDSKVQTFSPWPERKISNVKVPFLACLQYDCLESSSDVIYDLIRSLKTSYTTEFPTLDVLSQGTSDLDIEQAQQLVCLSEWRKQLMYKLSSYDIKGTIEDVDALSVV